MPELLQTRFDAPATIAHHDVNITRTQTHTHEPVIDTFDQSYGRHATQSPLRCFSFSSGRQPVFFARTALSLVFFSSTCCAFS